MPKTFSRDNVPRCEYCSHGLPCRNSTLIVCGKHGVMKGEDSCRSFHYDPIGRCPEAAPVIEKHDKSEFEI